MRERGAMEHSMMAVRFPRILAFVAVCVGCSTTPGPAAKEGKRPQSAGQTKGKTGKKGAKSGGGARSPSAALWTWEPTPSGCLWRERALDGGIRERGQTSRCPSDVWWSEDRSVAFAWTGSTVVKLQNGKDGYTPVAEHAVPDDAAVMWVVRDVPVIGWVQYGEATEVLTSQWTNTGFVAGPRRVLGEMDAQMGDLWATCPAGPISTSWTSFRRTIEAAASAGQVDEAPSQATLQLVRADADNGDASGRVSVGGSTLAFRVGFGDTPHPVPPLVWCADASCATGTPLSGRMPPQAAVMPAGQWVLVTSEYRGLGPTVYRAGHPTPVLQLDEDVRAMWAP